MKLLAFVPIKLTLLFIIGILLGHYFPFNSYFALVLTLVCFIGLGFIFQFEQHTKSVWFGILASLTTIALGAFIIIKAQPQQRNNHYSKLTIDQESVWHLKITEVLKPTTFSERYIAEVKSVDGSFATGKLLINKFLEDSLTKVSVDDELYTINQPNNIKPPLNPHQFSYKAYLKKLGIHHQMGLSPNSYHKSENPSSTLFGIAANARNHIIEKLKASNFGEDELGVIQALLLGQRSDISKETYDNYKNAGAVHILALSGLHIGILLLVLRFLLRPMERLPEGKKISLLLTVLLLWGFAYLAGLSASIVRACTMFSFVAYALYLNRPSNTFNILALSMFFILLFINPNLLFQVGFQMSYAAVLAIVWIYPLLQKLWFPKWKPVRYIWQLFSVSVAAQLGVLPISLFYFHQFPGLFFISNLLIIPVLGFILGTGILVIFLALIDQLPYPLAWGFNELITYMNATVAWVAKREDFIFKHISFDGIQLLLTYFLIAALGLLLSQVNFRRTAFFLVSVLCLQAYTMYLAYTSSQKSEVLLLHQTKNTIILDRNGPDVKVHTLDSLAAQNPIKAIKIGERFSSINYDGVGNSYVVQGKPLLILDSLGINPKNNKKPIVLLTHSPKINLDRFISATSPIQIIADGSNYTSYIRRWKATCVKHNIPFHYTGEKGFYVFDGAD
ncbi:ComEC/Rec2 family competence protein [Maribacter chungangensis]|uniref:ComEC/Rec2 family competence protein n=1 Tax=Maribacter chungangensis TaxID=1069117 RepID=A0ABW3B7U8_9FLAO